MTKGGLKEFRLINHKQFPEYIEALQKVKKDKESGAKDEKTKEGDTKEDDTKSKKSNKKSCREDISVADDKKSSLQISAQNSKGNDISSSSSFDPASSAYESGESSSDCNSSDNSSSSSGNEYGEQSLGRSRS